MDGARRASGILLTGVTGFLGQVILERLLLDFADTHVTVLVRGQTGSTAEDRVRYLLRKPAFDVLRERHGGRGPPCSSSTDQRHGDRGRLLPGRPRAPRRASTS